MNIFYIFFLKTFRNSRNVLLLLQDLYLQLAAVSMEMQVSDTEGGGDGICGTGQGACCAGSYDGCPAEAPECRK